MYLFEPLINFNYNISVKYHIDLLFTDYDTLAYRQENKRVKV